MVRIGCRQDLDDGLFAGLVDFGHKVVSLFAGDAKGFDVETGAIDDGASTSGSFDCRIEQWMHGLRLLKEQPTFYL